MKNFERLTVQFVAVGKPTVCPIDSIPATVPRKTLNVSNGPLVLLASRPLPDWIQVSIEKTLTIRQLNWTLATMLKTFLKNSIEFRNWSPPIKKAVVGFF